MVKMVALLDQKTGKVSKTTPRVLKSKQSAIIEVKSYSAYLLILSLNSWEIWVIIVGYETSFNVLHFSFTSDD